VQVWERDVSPAEEVEALEDLAAVQSNQPDRDLISCFLVLLVKGVFRVLALDNRITEGASLVAKRLEENCHISLR